MINSNECIEVLKVLVEKFEKRLKRLREMQKDVDESLQTKEKSDEKMALKYQKQLAKMQKEINKLDEKQLSKQERLLNSNHLQELEVDIFKNSIKISNEDTSFLQTLEEIIDEAKQSEFVDELNFTKGYLSLCEKTSQIQYDIFFKQQKFLEEVFEEKE